MQAVLLSLCLQWEEKQNGDSAKSPDETYARTRGCDLARNALRLYRENWTLSKHCTASMARTAPTGSGNFRTQQNHGIYEPVQDRAKGLSRRCFPCRGTQNFE